MNFQFYVEKLRNYKKYKLFKRDFPKAYPCSCFFVIDKEGNDNQQHFDFWVEQENENKGSILSFKLEAGGELVPVDNLGNIPKEISLDIDFSFDDIEKIIEEKVKEEKIKNKIQKYLFSLQEKDGKHYLIGTLFLSMMGLLKVSVNLETMKIEDFEKKSFFDVMKVKHSKNEKDSNTSQQQS